MKKSSPSVYTDERNIPSLDLTPATSWDREDQNNITTSATPPLDSPLPRDQSTCLNFVDPLTPAIISSCSSRSNKRKWDDSSDLQVQRSGKRARRKEQQPQTSHVLRSTTPLPLCSGMSEASDCQTTLGDFTSLFDPKNFQACDVTWPQIPISDGIIPTSFDNPDTFDSLAFLDPSDNAQWDGVDVGVPLAPTEDGGTGEQYALSVCLPVDNIDGFLSKDRSADLFGGGMHVPGFYDPTYTEPFDFRALLEDSLSSTVTSTTSTTDVTSTADSDIIRELRKQLLQKDALIEQLKSQGSMANLISI